MGRAIVADESVEAYISRIQDARRKRMGIIIGQGVSQLGDLKIDSHTSYKHNKSIQEIQEAWASVLEQSLVDKIAKCGQFSLMMDESSDVPATKQKDFVLALAVTPDDEADGANVVGKAAREPGKEHGRNQDIDISAIDTQWLATHAQQVNRMLVGGMDIIGVFVTVDQGSLHNVQDQLRQSIYAVFKRLGKAIRRPLTSDLITERVVLTINTTTKKLQCRTYDIADPKAGATPAEWKYQSLKDKWIRLECSLTVDVDLSFDKGLESQLINKKIQGSIAPFCGQVENAEATVNDQLYAQPDDTQFMSLYKIRDLANTALNIDLFTNTACRHNITKPRDTECCSKLSLYGRICGRAYVHLKATLTEGINAVKTDLVRSLMARCELLAEDIEITEGESTYMQFYKPPSRVFAQPLLVPVCFTDYIFADEEPLEVVERFSELLDVTVPVDSLDLDCERYPDEIDLPETTSSDTTTLISGHSMLRKTSLVGGSTDTLVDRRFSLTTRISDTTMALHPSLSSSSLMSSYILAGALIVALVSIIIAYIIYHKAS